MFNPDQEVSTPAFCALEIGSCFEIQRFGKEGRSAHYSCYGLKESNGDPISIKTWKFWKRIKRSKLQNTNGDFCGVE
jgi:hypothetical protein